MPLVNAKCTNCGANLQVDNTKDAAICQYCGSAYIVEKAINNYNTVNNIHANVVNIYGGNSADFVIRAGVLEKYNGASTHAIIPNSVHRIGGEAFENCYGLKQVTIPSTVTYIDGWAFINCISLEKVNIPQGVEFIGARAFEGCKKLETVNIPNTVKEISILAFSNCTRLKSIYIPNSVTIYADAFKGCTNLVDVSFEDLETAKRVGGCFPYSPTACKISAEARESQIRQKEKEKEQQKQQQEQNWRRAGVCDWCGGNFKGLVVKKCARCGRNKQY